MIHRRITAIALPLLLAAGCAQMAPTGAQLPAGQRFAAQLEVADHNAEAAILRMTSFEQTVLREEAAVAYATTGRRTPAAQAGRSAAEAAGMVVAPAFTAIGDYGHILAQAAQGQAISAKPSPSGTELARATEAGLAAVAAAARVNVPAPVREAGLAGIRALADLPETIVKRGQGTPSLQAMAQEAEPHVAAVTALLRAVLGAETGQAVRGAIRARRGSLEAAHNRLLASAGGSSPIARYELYRSIAALRDNDPAQGHISGIVNIVTRMHAAHAALAADPSSQDTAGKVAAFEAAVAELGNLAQVQQEAAAQPER